jgi:CheY-like chemotaxis protein
MIVCFHEKNKQESFFRQIPLTGKPGDATVYCIVRPDRTEERNLKKIVIAERLKSVFTDETDFLPKLNASVHFAESNDKVLEIHEREKANLIIAAATMPGLAPEKLYAKIRSSEALRKVSLLVVCSGAEEEARAKRAHPNAILTLPQDRALLEDKIRELLSIPFRESYRVLLSLTIEGTSRDQAFFCRSENISATGMMLETDHEMAKGDRIACAFFLPGSQQIRAAGTVVRMIDPAGKTGVKRYGVKFDTLSVGDKLAVETFIAKKIHSS